VLNIEVRRSVWTMFQSKHTKQNPYLLVLFSPWIFCSFFCEKGIFHIYFFILEHYWLPTITRNYYTKLCTIHWSPYHGSSAKLLRYNGVSSTHSILKQDLSMLC